MGKVNEFLQQIRQTNDKIAGLKEELEDRELETSYGGGMVKIRISGKQEILDLKLNKECVDPDDVEALENLLKTSVNQAINSSQKMVTKSIDKVLGGLDFSGLT